MASLSSDVRVFDAARPVAGLSTRLDRAIAVGLGVAVVFTALAHGAVEAWSRGLFELITIALLAMWGIKIVADRRLVLEIPTIALPVAAFLIVGLAQSVAWMGTNGQRISLSMDPETTRATVTMLFFLLVACVMAANFLRNRLRIWVKFLAIFGLALAFFGLVQHFTWDGNFYWWRPSVYAQDPFGPFVNRNHFAGYMELLIPLAVTLSLTRGVRREERVLFAFAAILMALAAIVSLSRGGIISVFAQLIFIAAFSLRPPERRPDPAGKGTGARMLRLLMIAALFVAILAGVIWMGAEPVINRLATGQASGSQSKSLDTSSESRVLIWKDTWAIIRAHAFLGVGLGAFETAYPLYTQDHGLMDVTAQAHNDYLQVLADTGLVGGVIALWFIILVFQGFAKGRRARDPWLASFALGCGGAIFGLLVHSLFDFNLQLPSTALLFLLLSAAVSQIGSATTNPQMLDEAVGS